MNTENTIQGEVIERTLDGAIAAVCNFWAEKMQKPLNQNNGDDSPQGGMVFALMNTTAMHAQKSITPEKIEVFKGTLREIIKIKFAGYDYWCDVDYHPSEDLEIATREAGIEVGCIPIKSSTVIAADFSVRSRYQYGGPSIIIY